MLRKAALILILVALACDDGPTPARPTAWHWVAAFPPAFREIGAVAAARDGAVYLAGADWDAGDSKAAVYRYSGGEFTRVFRSSRAGSEFKGICAGGGFVWAAGEEKISAIGNRPYAARYDGTRWEEVPFPADIPARGFYDVYVQRPDCVWFESGPNVYIFRQTAWKEIFHLGNGGWGDLAVTENGRAYLMACNLSPQEWVVYVSDDEGARWAREVLPRTYGVYSIAGYFNVPIAPAGNGLYIATKFNNCGEDPGNHIGYYGIIKRDDAPAGRGNYSLAFVAPHGPNFYSIQTMAFRSPDDGCALGPMTSAALEDGAWTLEQMPAGMPSLEEVAPSDTHYWAVLKGDNVYAEGLWRTP